MFWAFLAGIGACANAAYFVTSKKFLERLDPYPLAAACFLSTAVFLLGIAGLTTVPAIGEGFLFAAVASAVLNIAGTILTFRALASADISLAIPMLSFTPLFLLGTAAVMLGEFPSLVGILGILVMVTGSYILNTSAEHERLTDPFRAMLSHPGVAGMLVVAFLYAIAINYDKVVVLNSDPYFGAGFVVLLMGAGFVVLSALERYGLLPEMFCNPHPITDGCGGTPPASWRYLLFAGVVTGALIAIEAVTIYTAYLTQIVPYVISIKRLSLILVVLYGTIVFREKDLLRRVAGAGMMVLGAVLILLFP